MKLNKRVFIVIVIISIIIIAVIIMGIFIAKRISANIKVQETEEKLSKINGEELQEKIIARLEDSVININNSEYETEFGQLTNNKKVNPVAISIEVAASVYDIDYRNIDYQENFISAIVLEKKKDSINTVIIPCFRIAVDKNGNFHSIEFVYKGKDAISSKIGKIIEEVFSNEYGIDMEIENNTIYNKKFNDYANTHKFIIMDVGNMIEPIYKEITGENYNKEINQMNTKIFGFKK